ncbi:MAG: preprotein translocase subunit SecA [Candidatus Dojkabacteria bacterium]|nr:MAG: preprotein translocase subunit SecA [Candidatus Dojkabacteria bacterium]
MIGTIKNLFSPNEKELAMARKILSKVLEFEDSVKQLSDEELAKSTEYFRKKLGIDIEKRKADDIYFDEKYPEMDEKELLEERKKLYEILPEVYARVREVAGRIAKHEHFSVQLMTGILLAHNKVTEVFTGEGKTNSAVLPAYLFGLTGRGVHVATVNDYLAKRDGEWAGQVMHALGMNASIITANDSYQVISDEEVLEIFGKDAQASLDKKDMSNMSTMVGTNLKVINKKQAYKCDVTYGQASEFGFDYLRDNMANSLEERVQRYYYYSIVDEADSILIDEARTPLIISVPDEQPSEVYYRFATIAETLKADEDYIVDEKRHSVVLTDAGIKKVETAINVADIWSDSRFIKHIDNALKAKALYNKDKEYIVHNGEVLIVDQFTGRAQQGRRYSEGLHQAIEAKERVDIRNESKTLATISYQNYFRLYSFLAGMTGTAMTEAEEFAKIYKLDVVRVPTHKKITREDLADVIYKSEKSKYDAVVEDIIEKYKQGRPVLAGTTSIEKSEYISTLLRKRGIPHQVLNAKLHEKEAKIIAAAGQKATVTIATNMAGRGTDIKLSPEVKELGGLHIIGTERHEARRIDNQLRGRSGRLGDPGSSRFYLSLGDHLMRVFGGDMIKNVLGGQLPEDIPLESGLLSGIIKKAQEKVESLHFDIRKRLVEYDDVLNFQRETVYKMRKLILLLLHNVQLPPLKNTELSDIEIITFLQKLGTYSLKRSKDAEAVKLVKETYMDFPLRMWTMKQVWDQILHIMGGDIRKEKQIPEEQARILREFIETCIPNDLQEKAAKAMGLKSYAEFLEKNFVQKKKTFTVSVTELFKLINAAWFTKLQELEKSVPNKEYERYLIMSSLDFLWMDHIDAMSDLREGIGFRGYAQRDPLVEYKREGTALFNGFFDQLADMIARKMFRIEAVSKQQQDAKDLIRDAVRRSVQNNNGKKAKKGKKRK